MRENKLPEVVCYQTIDFFAKFNVWPPDLVFCDGWLDFTQTINGYLCMCMQVSMYTCITHVTCRCLCLWVSGCLNQDIITYFKFTRSGGQTPSFEFRKKFIARINLQNTLCCQPLLHMFLVTFLMP